MDRKNIRCPADHSALIPADLMTLAHFSVSSAMNLPKSADEPANTAHPRSVRRFFMLGSGGGALISWWSFSTIWGGVFGAWAPDGLSTPIGGRSRSDSH